MSEAVTEAKLRPYVTFVVGFQDARSASLAHENMMLSIVGRFGMEFNWDLPPIQERVQHETHTFRWVARVKLEETT